jgi:hypothetical protein
MDSTDEELVRAFESRTLPPDRFDHAAHVRVAWCYLRTYSLGAAIDRFREGIQAFAAAHGATAKYHETMTVAYLLLIAERLYDSTTLTWDEFAARHPELLAKTPLVLRYYTEATLQSDRARQAVVMPDRLAPV